MDAVAPNLDRTLPFYDRAFLSMINDPRDLPFVHLMVQCAIVAVMGLGLYAVPADYIWYFAVAY